MKLKQLIFLIIGCLSLALGCVGIVLILGSILLPHLSAFHKSKKRVRTVLFDLDGTLLDTLEDLKDSVNHVLRAHGYCERTLEEVRAMLDLAAQRDRSCGTIDAIATKHLHEVDRKIADLQGLRRELSAIISSWHSSIGRP